MELRDYWRILRAHWAALLIFTVLGGAIAFGWTLLQPTVYSANASGIVSTGVSSDLGAALAGDNYAKSGVKAHLSSDALAKSLQNLERVNARPLGIILNGVPRKGADADAYGYQYHGYYGSTGSEQPTHVPQESAEITAADVFDATEEPATRARGGRA